jgi:hypothetical protein
VSGPAAARRHFNKGGVVAQIGLIVFGLGNLVCLIIMVVKLIQAGYTLQGVLGIFCGLVAFIYGWMKADELGAKNIMLAWTGCIIGQIIFAVVGGGMGMATR